MESFAGTAGVGSPPAGESPPAGPIRSVRHDPGKCDGCSACAERCPVGAVRTAGGRARIDERRCIDCGECVRSCPRGARRAYADPPSVVDGFDYRVVVPAPALFGQFEGADAGRLEAGLLGMGFDEVRGISEAARTVARATRELVNGRAPRAGAPALPRPILSSACPAVLRLVLRRFPGLVPRLAPLLPPMEVAARVVKEGLGGRARGAGVFFVTPCAGKATVARSPLGYRRSALDGVIGLRDVLLPLGAAVASTLHRDRRRSAEPAPRLAKAASGPYGGSISVNGIREVVSVLKDLERGRLDGLSYIEALACPGGCVGGPLAVEDPRVAAARLRALEAARGAEVPEGRTSPRERAAPSLEELLWTEYPRPDA